MKNKVYFILRLFYDIVRRIINIFKIPKLINECSYYPEKKQKNMIRRYIENFLWILKYTELNRFYNLYGFDVKNKTDQGTYVNYYRFMRDRNRRNRFKNDYNYICLLRDKYLFTKYFESNHISVVNNIAIIKNGVLYDDGFNKIRNIKEVLSKEIFIKSIDGECASGVFHISNYSEYQKKKSQFSKGVFIVQEKIVQHRDMSKLNPKSVNTIRIVTINRDDKIFVLNSVLRVGTSKSGNVDNWAAGGLVIEINEGGSLTKYGFAKPKFGGKTYIHPDTKIKFEGYKIPFYKDVIKLVTNAHRILYNIHSIGWDVAITENGPILIEGNDNWEISLMQVNRGLKKQWAHYCK